MSSGVLSLISSIQDCRLYSSQGFPLPGSSTIKDTCIHPSSVFRSLFHYFKYYFTQINITCHSLATEAVLFVIPIWLNLTAKEMLISLSEGFITVQDLFKK